jgi:hypothetical protein
MTISTDFFNFRSQNNLFHTEIDFHIGLPPSEVWRVARLTSPDIRYRLSEIITDYSMLRYLFAIYRLYNNDDILARISRNPDWMQVVSVYIFYELSSKLIVFFVSSRESLSIIPTCIS